MSKRKPAPASDSDPHDLDSASLRFETLRMALLAAAVINGIYLVRSLVEKTEPGGALLMLLLVQLPLAVVITVALLWMGFKVDGACALIAAHQANPEGERTKLWGLGLLMLAIALVVANWVMVGVWALR